jgi:predicted amidohydrolase YtcJ
VLSADPLTVAESAIREITAGMTIAGGKIVHQSANRPG